MLPLLRTILLLLWFRNFSEVYDFNLMTLLRNIYHTGLLVTGSCIFVDNNPPYQDDAFKQFLNVEEMAQVL